MIIQDVKKMVKLQYSILYGELKKFKEIDLPYWEFERQFQNNLCTEH